MIPKKSTIRQGGLRMLPRFRTVFSLSLAACHSFVILMVMASAIALFAPFSARASDLNWLESLDEAAAVAQSTDKPILAFFTGSDWCPHCKTLEKKVLNTPAFRAWAEDTVVLLEIDLPQEGISREERAVRTRVSKFYGVRSFPSVLLIATDGSVIHRQAGYAGQSAPRYIELLAEQLSAEASAVAGKPAGSTTVR